MILKDTHLRIFHMLFYCSFEGVVVIYCFYAISKRVPIFNRISNEKVPSFNFWDYEIEL